MNTLNKEPFQGRATSGAHWRLVAIALVVLAVVGVLALRSYDASAALAPLDSKNQIFDVTKESSGAVTYGVLPISCWR